MRFDSSINFPVNVVALSTDGGNSFPPYAVAAGAIPGEPCNCCPISVVANNDVAAVLYRNNDSNIRDTWASLSYDNANMFNAEARMDSNNWMLMSCPSSGPDGYIFGDTLVTVFMNGAGSNGDKVYIGSMDHVTQEVQAQKQIFMTMSNTNQNFPRIDGVGDTLGVVWKQLVGAASEVMFAYSFTGPAGIGVWVDTLTSGMSGSQAYPDIAYGDGKLHVTFENQATGDAYYMFATLPGINTAVSTPDSELEFELLKGREAWTVRIPKPGVVQMVDAVGKVLQTTVNNATDSTVKLDVTKLAAGTYVVRYTANGKSCAKKVVLER